MATAIEKRWQSRMTSVGEAAQYLFNNPQSSDMTFSCQNSKGITQLIHAHSFVLVMRSPIFYDLIVGNIAYSQTITIDDFSYEAFLSFMRYVYGAKFVMDTHNATDLYNIGLKYEVDCLVTEYREFIANVKLSLTNICEYLEMSLKIDSQSLKVKAIEFVGEHGKKLLSSDSFKNLSPEALKEVLSREKEIVNTSEVEIFKSVMQWAEHRCQLNKFNVNPINMRRSLGDLIKLVRFTAMSPLQFAECIERYDGVISLEEKCSIYDSISTNRRDGNKLGFSKPREANVNLKHLTEQKIRLGDYSSWGACDQYRTKFTVNSRIYLTQVTIAATKTNIKQNIKIIIGDNGVSLYEQTVMLINLQTTNFIFTRPIELLPSENRVYFIDIILDNPKDNLFCCTRTAKFPVTKSCFYFWGPPYFSPILCELFYKEVK